jgi:AcrR family transcriptional regulator
MPVKKTTKELDTSTEAKIKAAARKVFHKKGFAATRTRDIAEEAGLNLALLNYYFRSKEKLFEQIMLETMFGFMQNMALVFNDEGTSLEKKVELMADKYIDLMLKEPEIPLFIMSEIRSDAAGFLEKLPIGDLIMNSAFIKQYKKAVADGKVTEPNPLHFLMNVMGMVIFPFIASPLLRKIGSLKDKQFEKMMLERKQLIPVWIKAMLKAK